jgi:orotate phosphoribosyltransferase
MLTNSDARSKLLTFLQRESIFHGDFVLSSGAKSTYYVDCKLTTLHPHGAWLVAQVMHDLIKREASARGLEINAVGGLTMGADPIALTVGLFSFLIEGNPLWKTFIVRKTPKSHGQAKMIEGNFKKGDTVVVIDDVVTRGDSTITAIRAIEAAGGKVAFVAVLVDRQQGGREKIEELGHRVVAAFKRDDLIPADARPHKPADCVPA